MVTSSFDWQNIQSNSGLFYKLQQRFFEDEEVDYLVCAGLSNCKREAEFITRCIENPKFSEHFKRRLSLLVGAYLIKKQERFIVEADRLASLIILSSTPLSSSDSRVLTYSSFVPDSVNRVMEAHKGRSINTNWMNELAEYSKKGLPKGIEVKLYCGWRGWILGWEDCHPVDQEQSKRMSKRVVIWSNCIHEKGFMVAYMQWEVIRAVEKISRLKPQYPVVPSLEISNLGSRSLDCVTGESTPLARSSSGGSNTYRLSPGRTTMKGSVAVRGVISQVTEELESRVLTMKVSVECEEVRKLCVDVVQFEGVKEKLDDILKDYFHKVPSTMKSGQDMVGLVCNTKSKFLRKRASGCILQIAAVAPMVFPKIFINKLQDYEILL